MDTDDSPPYPWADPETDSVRIFNSTQSPVIYDVTQDLIQFQAGTPNYGWLIMKNPENIGGRIQFWSKEGTEPATLRIVYE